MRSSVSLGHKLIAVVIATATAFGLYAFLRYHGAQQASAASLSFDSAAAQQLDPNLSRAPHPAVVLGQSILSDSVVATLLPRPEPAASSTDQAIGEFRARLELTQPATGLLLVRYRDPDPAQAADNANAVAKALAGWAPASASSPHPAANVQPAPSPSPQVPGPQATPAPIPAAAPIPAPTASPAAAHIPAPTPIPAPTSAALRPAPAAETSLAALLGELHAQLSAADQHAGSDSSFRSEHDRQRYLETQVRAAQQKLDDLRKKFSDAGPASGARAPLDVVQHALALFWPSAVGINTAGTSEAQLKYERGQLTRDIGIVAQQQQGAQRAEAADSATTNVPQQQTAPVASQPQPAPAPAPAPKPAVQSPSASLGAVNPLHLQHMAALPAPVAWWPAALAGFFCGLLYLGIAFARSRASREFDDEFDLPEKGAPSMYGLSGYGPSGMDAPVRATSRDEWIEAYPAETSLHKHGSFSFDKDSDSASLPDRPSDQPASPGPTQHSTKNTAPNVMPEPTAVPPQTHKPETASDADAVAPRRTPEEQEKVSDENHVQEKHVEEKQVQDEQVQDQQVQEKHVENANSWEDEIRKNLSQTSLARMLDSKPIAEDVADDVTASKGPVREAGDPPSKPGRLVG